MTLIAPPKTAAGRDHRIDFWRGVALVMIFVNHVPGNAWERFTSRNFGFSDAAELFVFLAGFAAAFAYGKTYAAGQRFLAVMKAWRRAGILYLVQMMLTVLTISLFAWAALAFGDGNFLMRINLANLVTEPVDTMVGLATLGNQFGYVNILPMYTILLLMLPMHLWLATKNLNLMLGCAVALWVASWTFNLNLPNYPNPGGWFFNPFAWQIIFAAGLYAGFRKLRGLPSLPYRPWLLGAALAYLLFAFVVCRYGLWFLLYELPLPGLVATIDKTFVTLPRLLHVLALAYVFANASPTSPFARIERGNLLAMIGRHSLPVFALGTMLSLVCQVIKWERDQAFLFDTGLIAMGLALQFALAWWLEWWGDYQKRHAKPAAASAARAERPVASGSSAAPASAIAGPEPAVVAQHR